jgi:serine/threonine protein phosphatase 1
MNLAVPTSARPETPVFAIGDIHGHYEHFKELCAEALALRKSYPTLQLVILGDIIDRGPQSLECLEYLVVLRNTWGTNLQLIAGNHEQFMFASLFGSSPALASNAFANWLKNGGQWALFSENFMDELPTFLKNHNLTPENWKTHYMTGNCIFVHAGVPVNATNEQLTKFFSVPVDVLPAGSGNSFVHPMWIRKSFIESDNPIPGRFVIHGHTPPDYTGVPKLGRLNLDAGSYSTGKVSGCLLFPSGGCSVITLVNPTIV